MFLCTYKYYNVVKLFVCLCGGFSSQIMCNIKWKKRIIICNNNNNRCSIMCTHFFSFVFYDLCWPIEFDLEILLFVSNRPCPPALHVASSVANAMRLQRPLVPQRPRVAAHATRHVASASVALTRRNKDLGWRSLQAHSGFFRFCLFLRLMYHCAQHRLECNAFAGNTLHTNSGLVWRVGGRMATTSHQRQKTNAATPHPKDVRGGSDGDCQRSAKSGRRTQTLWTNIHL